MYYPCSENKGADQLRCHREADLRLCFRICKKPVFSRCGSYGREYNVLQDGPQLLLLGGGVGGEASGWGQGGCEQRSKVFFFLKFDRGGGGWGRIGVGGGGVRSGVGVGEMGVARFGVGGVWGM